MRDDLAIVKFLQTLHDRLDDLDDNSYDNTTIQFFESPHDSATLTAYMQTFVNGASIPSNPNETVKLTAQMTPNVADPSTFTYGGYDSNGNLWSAGWYWGYGGVWK
jgi:hypothetical protein